MAEKRTKFGRDVEQALREVVAHQKGKIALPSRVVTPIAPGRVKAIRKSLAKSPKEFERRFGIPARTLEGWEQGRKLDSTASILLTVIEKEPAAVERALAGPAGKGKTRGLRRRTAAPDALSAPRRRASP